MIQAKVTSSEKRKFILGNVAETWNQASGRKKEASTGVFLHSQADGAEHSPACSRAERPKTILLSGSLKRSHYKEYLRTASETAELGLGERSYIPMSTFWQIVLF